MAEKRDTWAGQSDEDSDDVEGHKFAPDDDKFEKRESDDADDEVEAHKY